MEKLGRFAQQGQALIKITQLLGDVNNSDSKLAEASRNLCKLLYYTEDNPLEQPTGTPLNPNQPRPIFESISDVRLHIMKKRILRVPRVPTEEERGAFVIVILDNFSLSENKEFKVNSLTFDVLAHHDNWELDNNLRPFLIMEQIDTLFNQRKLSIGSVEWRTANTIVLTPSHLGYQLVYRDVLFN